MYDGLSKDHFTSISQLWRWSLIRHCTLLAREVQSTLPSVDWLRQQGQYQWSSTLFLTVQLVCIPPYPQFLTPFPLFDYALFLSLSLHSCFSNYQMTITLHSALHFPPSPAAPSDYNAVLNRMVTFGPTDEKQSVLVTVNSDGIADPAEMFLARLSLPAGSSNVAISGGDATATVINGKGLSTLCWDHLRWYQSQAAQFLIPL